MFLIFFFVTLPYFDLFLKSSVQKSYVLFSYYAEIRRKTGQPPVIELLKRRQWTYLGHVLRMEESRLPRTTYEWKPDGRRKRGCPKNTLRRTHDQDLRTAGTSLIPEWEDVIAAAPMRDEWRGFVDALCATDGTGGTKV